jgi:hypothetical protein
VLHDEAKSRQRPYKMHDEAKSLHDEAKSLHDEAKSLHDATRHAVIMHLNPIDWLWFDYDSILSKDCSWLYTYQQEPFQRNIWPKYVEIKHVEIKRKGWVFQSKLRDITRGVKTTEAYQKITITISVLTAEICRRAIELMFCIVDYIVIVLDSICFLCMPREQIILLCCERWSAFFSISPSRSVFKHLFE